MLSASPGTGGGERDRTDDLLLAKQALSQLSYTPDSVVGLDGFEPSTPRLSSVCSNQLSYRPVFAASTQPSAFSQTQKKRQCRTSKLIAESGKLTAYKQPIRVSTWPWNEL